MRISFEFSKIHVSVSFHINFELTLTNSQNSCIVGLIEYDHATWLTSLNHDQALVISDGCEKFWVALRMVSVGETPVDVTLSPTNSMVPLQN